MCFLSEMKLPRLFILAMFGATMMSLALTKSVPAADVEDTFDVQPGSQYNSHDTVQNNAEVVAAPMEDTFLSLGDFTSAFGGK